jgi:hypothetical protein
MIYRLIFGASTVAILFTFVSFFGGSNYVKYISCFIILINFIFSIYPTSAKLIFSSISSNMGEIQHLDKLEKMLLSIFLIYFIASTPNLSFLNSSGYESFLTQDLFHQNYEFVSSIFNGVSDRINILGYFYFFFGSVYYLLIYSFFRFFFSRRVSLIGILAIITNWNLMKMIYGDFTTYATSIYLVSFLWSFIWVSASKSYRTNLFFGMILALSTHHPFQISLSFLLIGTFSALLANGTRTWWSRMQSLKYMSFGLVVTLFLGCLDLFVGDTFNFQQKWILSFNLFFKKAFNILGFVGIFVFLIFYFSEKFNFAKKRHSFLKSPNQLMFSLIFGFVILGLSRFGQNFDISAYLYFVIVLFCLPALELVLNSFGIFHPRRNLIFFLYIMFAILDSHFESRVKTFISLF